jgi:hypothetical protein
MKRPVRKHIVGKERRHPGLGEPAGELVQGFRLRVLDLAEKRIELIREDRRQHMMRMARLVPPLVEEFRGRLTDEEIRQIADGILDTYDEVPIRSFVMTLANRRAREILKERTGAAVRAW